MTPSPIILVHCDPCDIDRCALNEGVRFSLLMHAGLHLVGIAANPAWQAGYDVTCATPMDVAENDTRRLLAESAEIVRCRGIEATTHCAIGAVDEQITRIAQILKPDLVILSRRPTLLGNIFRACRLRSRLVGTLPCSVLTVPVR